MFVHRRAVRFQDVDAAHIVFFPVFLEYAHEAMEAFFDQLDGGYRGLICARRVGLPSVRLETDFASPLRFGDVVRVELSTLHVGRRSVRLGYGLFVGARRAASIEQVVVATCLDRLVSLELPADVRALAVAHLATR